MSAWNFTPEDEYVSAEEFSAETLRLLDSLLVPIDYASAEAVASSEQVAA